MTDTGTTHGRRTFMKGIGASATAVAGIGAFSARGQASVVQSAAGAGISGPAYLVARVKDHLSGTNETDDYEDLQERDLYLETRSDGVAIEASNEQIFTQINNLLDYAQSGWYQVGRAAVLESLNDGDSPTVAAESGQNGINEEATVTQKNLVERWETVLTQMQSSFQRIDQLDEVDTKEIWSHFLDDSLGREIIDFEIKEGESVTYEDGTEEEIRYIHVETESDPFYVKIDGSRTTDEVRVTEDPEAESSEPVTVVKADDFEGTWEDIKNTANEARSDLEAFVDGIQDDYLAGDIDTEDIASPRDLWEMGSDDSENPLAAADLAGLGLEINQSSSVSINLVDSDEMIEGDVYLSESPMGESLEVGLFYDPEASRSTDDDGDPDDDLDDYDGDADDPVPLDGLTFVAYNTDDESTYAQLQEPFEVISAVDEDGEDLDNVSYEPSTGQQTTSTDIDELREELEALTEEQIRVEEERAELAGGGAGGFLADTNSTVVAAVAAVAGIWVLFGGDS